MSAERTVRRFRGAWAMICLVAALVAGALLVFAHWRAQPFDAAATVSARGAGHGVQAAVEWPAGDVDVNVADVETLQTLSGVGPALAEAIRAEREANGPFDYPEDIVMVSGIGAKTLAKFYGQLDFSSRTGAP